MISFGEGWIGMMVAYDMPARRGSSLNGPLGMRASAEHACRDMRARFSDGFGDK